MVLHVSPEMHVTLNPFVNKVIVIPVEKSNVLPQTNANYKDFVTEQHKLVNIPLFQTTLLAQPPTNVLL
jgi:hypothetical protein